MSEVSGRQVDVHRTRRTIRDSDPGVVKVGLQLLGRGLVVQLVQHEREATLFPGYFAVYDTSVPYTLHFEGEFTMFRRDATPRVAEDPLETPARGDRG